MLGEGEESAIVLTLRLRASPRSRARHWGRRSGRSLAREGHSVSSLFGFLREIFVCRVCLIYSHKKISNFPPEAETDSRTKNLKVLRMPPQTTSRNKEEQRMLDLRHLTTGLCLLNQRLIREGIAVMTLRDFIQHYHEELEDYYDEDFGSGERILDNKYGSTVVFCLVDTRVPREDGFSEFIPRHIRKKLRRAGKWRRDKLKHQWSYANPMNRVQGYIVVKDLTNIHRTTKTLSLSCICSTSYTERRGIGGELMGALKDYGEDAGYADIILEVANEFSAKGMSDEFWAEKEAEEEEKEEEEKEGETQEMNMTNKVNIEFLRDQLEKALSDIEDLKDKVRANGNGAH